MVRLILCFLFLVTTLSSWAADAVVDLSLNDGSKIKGRVMTATAQEVTVMTDFGVLRIDQAKLTPESKKLISDGAKPDVDALLRRIAELEAKVSQLQQENEMLRKQAMAPSASPSTAFIPSSRSSITPSPSSGLQYSRSSTGKRHNSGCRYFTPNSICGPNEGVACKICGG